jgi:enoyl-CoA hydratase
VETVLSEVRGGLGVATMNRPAALNSLDTPMVEKMLALYSDWDRPESPVHCVALRGAGGKAFCAGKSNG